MKIDLQILQPQEIPETSPVYREFIDASDPIIALYYDGELAATVGFIPFPDRTYLWMDKTSLAMAHPRTSARWSKRIVDLMLTRYPIIVGHSNPESTHWLQFLGAAINPLSPTLVEFAIHG